MYATTPEEREDPVRSRDSGATAWVTSPHLLVAQAVAAALRGAGIPCSAGAWHEVVHPREPSDDESGDHDHHVVAILDGFEGRHAIDDLARLATAGRVRIVVVTSDSAAVSYGSLLAAESVEVVTHASSVADLVDVMARFLAGQSVMDDRVRTQLRDAWVEAVGQQQHVIALVNSLTPQQRRILELLASGHRVTEVAVIIDVTSGTVRSHVKSLRARLGVRTQLEAVAMLRQMHVVGEDIGRLDVEVEEDGGLVPRPRAAATEESGVTPRR